MGTLRSDDGRGGILIAAVLDELQRQAIELLHEEPVEHRGDHGIDPHAACPRFTEDRRFDSNLGV